MAGSLHRGWYRVDDGPCDGPDELPAGLWKCLTGDVPGDHDRVLWKRHATERDAAAALGAACVRYGRRLAGVQSTAVV